MPHYAIMRHTKLKQGGNLGASLEHCYRERDTENADPEKTPDNEFLISESKAEVLEKMQKILPEKVRKNGVVAVEYMMTASPEFWKTADEKKQKEFFDKSMEYLKEKYGEKNIVSATVHRDETSPHLSAYVVPMTKDGRLCARDFLGGRKLLREAQTEYAKKVEHLGLVRGIEGSKAKHQTIKEYYQEINQEPKESELTRVSPSEVTPRVQKTGMMSKKAETPEQVANRINQKVQPVVEDLTHKAQKRRFERKRAKETAETLYSKNKRLKQLENVLIKGLGKEQITKLIKQAQSYQQENKREQQRDIGIDR
jgi:hypothetical protein